MKKTKIGIIGCGMISDIYFNSAKRFRNLDVVGCCDINPAKATEKAEKYQCRLLSYDEMLHDKEMEIIVNLTAPKDHAAIAMDVLRAGKNTYSEKPFGVNMDEAAAIMALAETKKLHVGCAPDTFMGGGQQTARKLIDDGWIGKPLSGMAMVLGRGPEKWPHAPFFYDHGAGPMLDLGPYYITALVNLLGPAKSVTAMAGKGFASRKIGSEVAPQYQDLVQPFGHYPVNVNTHLAGVIEFESGALISVVTSFDVITDKTDYYRFQIHGSEGTLALPDPNGFGGDVKVSRSGYESWVIAPKAHIYNENSRSIGVADMALAIEEKRSYRASGALANHVLEIMLAFDRSNTEGKRIELQTRCNRPAPIPLGLEDGEIA